MYELTRVRLRSVGPWGARFDDVIMDLSKPWDDKLGIEEHAPDSNHELHAHPARSTAIFGKNGVGKSTLLRLISSVLAGNRPRRGPRYVSHAPSDDIGHIALEWRDLRTGSQLITGRVVRPHPDKMIGMSAGFYSFQSGETITLDTLPFEGAGSSEKVSSFRERLHAAFETGAGLTWVRSRVEWKKHLRDCGFNVHWFQWIVDHLLFDRVVQDWTEERFLEFVLREAVPGELLARLESLEGEYLNLRRRGSEVEDVLQESKKREMAELLDKIFEEALAIMADVQRLSRFPESVRSELGGCELFRVNLHRKSREQHVERLVEFLDDLTGKTEGDRILLRGLQKTQDISVEICVQSRPETGPPRYVPFAKVNRFPGQAAVMGRLFLMPLIGFAVARLAMSRDGELSGRFGPILLDDCFAAFGDMIVGIFLEIASALDLQVIYATAQSDPALLVRFSSVAVMQLENDSSPGDTLVRAAHPAGLAANVAEEPERDAVMDLVPFGEVFDVLRAGAEKESSGLVAQRQDLIGAAELTAWNMHRRKSDSPTFLQVSRAVRRQDLVRPGDFVLPRMWDGHPVPITVISSDEPPMVASESMLVLRPRSPLRPGEAFFYLEYFGGDNLLGALTDHGGLATVTPRSLNSQLIPVLDSATLTAITELTRAADSFQSWQRDAEDAIHGFFRRFDPEKARSYIIEAGRLTRQRREAASLANQVGTRLRTTLPYPIARRWREVQAARPDEVGYTLVLECAEAAIAYCAVLGIVFAREAQILLRSVRELPRQVRRGMTFTAWFNILREVSDVATVQDVRSDSPLAQFRCFADADVANTIRALHERRNQKSHRRGPAAHEVEDAVIEIRGQLEEFLSHVEWLVDYPLRHVDVCRWDSFTKVSQIAYRELMGDHNIVSPAEEHVPDMMETGSAYITDSYGIYRLLRPFLLTQSCPECGQLTVFVIDRWNATIQEADYLALDHTHKITVTGVEQSLQQVGLL